MSTSNTARTVQARARIKSLEPYLYISPTLILIGLTLFVPMLIGVFYSFTHNVVYEPTSAGFVGLQNYAKAWNDPLFWLSLRNMLVWTGASVLFELLFGLGLALLLVVPFPGRALYQALVFLPWAIPAFLSGLTWSWLLNPIIGPLPHWAKALGLLQNTDDILADPSTALIGPILAHIWFGIPFFAMTLLAALSAIPKQLYESAKIDGANSWQQFWFISVAHIAPVITVTVLLRTIWVANLPDLIWVMTRGGPANSTQITSSYAYSLVNDRLDYGYAAAISVIFMVLLVVYAFFILRLRDRFERAL